VGTGHSDRHGVLCAGHHTSTYSPGDGPGCSSCLRSGALMPLLDGCVLPCCATCGSIGKSASGCDLPSTLCHDPLSGRVQTAAHRAVACAWLLAVRENSGGRTGAGARTD